MSQVTGWFIYFYNQNDYKSLNNPFITLFIMITLFHYLLKTHNYSVGYMFFKKRNADKNKLLVILVCFNCTTSSSSDFD